MKLLNRLLKALASYWYIITASNTDRVIFWVATLEGGWAWRLATLAGWLRRPHPSGYSTLQIVATRLAADSAQFWAAILPPSVACIALILAAALGLYGLPARHTIAKMGCLFTGFLFFAFSGLLLWLNSPSHASGLPTLIMAAICGSSFLTLCYELPKEWLLLESAAEASISFGQKPQIERLPRRFRRKALALWRKGAGSLPAIHT